MGRGSGNGGGWPSGTGNPSGGGRSNNTDDDDDDDDAWIPPRSGGGSFTREPSYNDPDFNVHELSRSDKEHLLGIYPELWELAEQGYALSVSKPAGKSTDEDLMRLVEHLPHQQRETIRLMGAVLLVTKGKRPPVDGRGYGRRAIVRYSDLKPIFDSLDAIRKIFSEEPVIVRRPLRMKPPPRK